MSRSVKAERPPALPPPLYRPVGAVALLAALVVAVLAVLYSGDAAPSRIDRWTESAVETALPPAGTVALLIDFVAEPIGAAVAVPLLAALCLVVARRRLAVLAVAGPGMTVVVTTALKPAVGRTTNGHLAYPSGHTAFATALALVLTLLLVSLLLAGKLVSVLLILAAAGTAGAAMAWSQVALGAHYPTDTLGGFCSALAVVPVTAWLTDRVADRGDGAAGKQLA